MVIVDDSLVPLLAQVLPHATTIRHVLVTGPAANARRPRPSSRARGSRCTPTRTCSPASPTPSTGRSWTSGPPPPCATPAAPPATPRASSTATGRPTCTRWRVCMGNTFGAVRARPGAADRADVPRQRLGPAVRGVHDRRRPDHAGPVPAGRAAGPADRGGAADGRRRRADDLERRAAARARQHGGDLSSLRLVPCGGSAVPHALHGGVREGARRPHRPGLGDDRDLAARQRGAPARRRRRTTRRGATATPRAGWSARVEGGSSATAARCCRTTARRSARSRSAARGSPASYYKRRRPGEVPRRLAAHRRRRDDRPARLRHAHRPGQGRDQVRRRVDLLGGAGERADGAPGGRSRRRSSASPTRSGASGRWPPSCCAAGATVDRRGAAGLPGRAGAALAAARALGVHRRGAQDQRRQVRQEGSARRYARGDYEVIEAR